MTGRLEGKTAVITGGGNGIGRACAERFTKEGARIVIADLMPGPAEEAVAAVEALGGEAIFVELDVASPEANYRMAEAAVERFGSIDVVVTAAGISSADYVSPDT